MCALAVARADDATAYECGRHVLGFLEAALAHVPWHPSLAVERMQQSTSAAACGGTLRLERARPRDHAPNKCSSTFPYCEWTMVNTSHYLVNHYCYT